ncbi:MAG TPA: urate oxidase [Candidatus Acidoferrum sp.]|jgi:urate oxidase
MAIHLAENNYGKQRVRILRVSRKNDQHEIQELSIGIRLEGDFESAHTQGDNRKVLPTDTMKNTAYALARKHSIESPEKFCKQLASHFLSRNPQVSRAHVEAEETLWVRLPFGGKVHPHAFTRSSEEKRIAEVNATRQQQTVSAGIDGLVVLKTTKSAFDDFLRDEYTTLRETRDRILSTVICANWVYSKDEAHFGAIWEGVRQTMLETFAEHDSLSVQQTLYALGETVLSNFEMIQEIHLSLPNKHYIAVDLSPFGMDNPGEIFLPTDEPHGLIEATLRRD